MVENTVSSGNFLWVCTTVHVFNLLVCLDGLQRASLPISRRGGRQIIKAPSDFETRSEYPSYLFCCSTAPATSIYSSTLWRGSQWKIEMILGLLQMLVGSWWETSATTAHRNKGDCTLGGTLIKDLLYFFSCLSALQIMLLIRGTLW